jgi:hypothetical protein
VVGKKKAEAPVAAVSMIFRRLSVSSLIVLIPLIYLLAGALDLSVGSKRRDYRRLAYVLQG